MPSRINPNRVLEMVTSDPRLRTLSLAARQLWLELVMAMLHSARFGGPASLLSDPASSRAKSLAMIAAATEGEVELYLPQLLARGLLVSEVGGTLTCPFLAAGNARSEINRANALAGVAKRRAARAVAGQLEMLKPAGLAPASGGAGSPSEQAGSLGNSLNNSLSAPPLSLSLKESNHSKLKLKEAVTSSEFHRIGLAAFRAAGLERPGVRPNYGITQQWLSDGADEALILGVIGKTTNDRVSHLGYFTKAIMAAVAKGGASADGPEPGELSLASYLWTDAIQDWFRNGRKGPEPRVEEFRPGGARAPQVAHGRAA